MVLLAFNEKITNKILVNFKFYNTPTKSELKFAFSICIFIMFECNSSMTIMSSILLIFSRFLSILNIVFLMGFVNN